MKPLTLYPHEIRRLLDTGSVTVWRPMKPQPKWDTFGGYEAWRWECKRIHVHVWDEGREPDEVAFVNRCAPHPPGSERWVRETWSYYCDYENLYDCIRYKTDGACRKPDFHRFRNVSENTWYRFSMLCDGCGCKDHSWRSPVTMPRWASRMSATVAGVEARQVQAVTDKEASNAGANNLSNPCGYADTVHFACCHDYPHMPADKFRDWWQSRYGTWHADPWAWATKLERKEG